MLTIDELASIAIFATLPQAEIARIARTSADIRLAPGEFVVHEGDPGVLIVVVAGRLELSKLMRGAERVIGTRGPGSIFGEVPMVFGMLMQADARAVEATRVLRLEARDYHAAAAAAPEFSAAVGKLALERLGGLQGLAAETPVPQVTLLGHRWDSASHELKRFLSRNQILFEWVTLDAPDLAHHWPGPPPEGTACPALRLADGTVLTRPGARELASVLGLRTTPSAAEYDTVIVGGGPAGLAAAVYGASEGLRTLVVEREAPGGQAETSSRIENYLGFPSGISGDELASRALRQARRLGAEILIPRNLARLDPETCTIELDGGERLRARKSSSPPA
jgi:thioredoxin reductase (NADPH)